MIQATPQFYLFHTLGCHLCDDAQLMLKPMFEHFQLSWRLVDIAEPPSEVNQCADVLVEKWGLKIPVLYCTFTQSALHWPFGEEDVLHFFEQVINENN